MRFILGKKLFSSLTALTLLLSTTLVNANTISLVNANADATPADILIGTDDVGGSFSMNLDVVLDTGITAGGAITDITWDAGILQLDSYSTLAPLFDLGPIAATSGGFAQLRLSDLLTSGVMNGAFTLATLNFSYIGPGTASILLDPLVPSANVGEGWGTLVPAGNQDIIFGTINNATVSAVPLPPALYLFTSALVGMGFIGRRKQEV